MRLMMRLMRLAKISQLAETALIWAADQVVDYFLNHLLSGMPNFLQQSERDPIVLDLDGNGIELTTLSGSNIHFDFAGNGFAERTGWVASSDGILAIDANANGIVDDGLELFGSPTQDALCGP